MGADAGDRQGDKRWQEPPGSRCVRTVPSKASTIRDVPNSLTRAISRIAIVTGSKRRTECQLKCALCTQTYFYIHITWAHTRNLLSCGKRTRSYRGMSEGKEAPRTSVPLALVFLSESLQTKSNLDRLIYIIHTWELNIYSPNFFPDIPHLVSDPNAYQDQSIISNSMIFLFFLQSWLDIL